MRNTVFFLFVTIAIVFFVLQLLRNQRLRDKYAALWLLVGVFTIILFVFPEFLNWISTRLGFVVPSNFLFSIATLLLLGVSLHMSLAISQLEGETRILAEEIAILRWANENAIDTRSAGQPSDSTDTTQEDSARGDD